MQCSKKEPDISSGKSTSDSGLSWQSWWSPVESHSRESAFSKNSSLTMGVPAQYHQSVKYLDFSVQDQDSSSSQSTGQSYSRATSTEETNLNPQRTDFSQSDCSVAHGKHEDDEIKVSIPMEMQNYMSPYLHVNCNQSFPQLVVPFPDQCFTGMLSTYGPQALVMPARVPLPLDLSMSEPIYVNPKQYHGILRRRQRRAKLEAQNKLGRDRKPYLHESRHQHALKRARGTGGRFLNMKKHQDSEHVSMADGQNVSGSATSMSEPKAHQQKDYREGTSTTSCSDVTCTAMSDDLYHPLEFGFSGLSSCMAGSMKGGGGNYV